MVYISVHILFEQIMLFAHMSHLVYGNFSEIFAAYPWWCVWYSSGTTVTWSAPHETAYGAV